LSIKRHLIGPFSGRLTGKQNSIVDFCQSNVIKMYIWHGNRRKVSQTFTPVGPVRNKRYRLAEQNSNEVMMTQFYVNSFIAQMSKKISYFTPLWGMAYSANCNQTHVTKKQLSNMSKLLKLKLKKIH
jgi:hypothetical protein